MEQKMKIRKKLAYGIVVLLLLLAGNVFALSFGVSPTGRSYMLLPGAHIETWFTFGTAGGDQLGVRVETQIIPADWVSYDPNSFILQPRSQQRVNVTIDIPPDVQPGFYEGGVHARAVPVVDPNLNGTGVVIIGAATARLKITIGDDVDLDIVSIESSVDTLNYGEILDVNVTIENKNIYPLGIGSSPHKTYLTFTSGETDVSSFFQQVLKPVGGVIPSLETKTLAFSITQIYEAPFGAVTIDPTISCSQSLQ